MSDAFEEFGPYLVYERLGQGGMATVHRAEKRGVGIRRPIALKRLLPHVATDPALVKLFVDEARLASHLYHANVAQTYELGKVGDTFFIAMEYASGPTLAQIVRQCQKAAGEIPLTITVNILTQICEALDYAHNLCDASGQPLRIIHRDVSPANIIVTSAGIVKLIDFGIAKATISSVKTQTGFIKGKFGYIAPEYISGKIDARVDLFAVGVVAHEMMAGRRLFEGKDDFETLQNIREMNLSPPSRWNPHVTTDLDDIVMTALQRDPADRWQSAQAMQVALAHVAREFGMVVGSHELAEWVEWAFRQVSPGAGPATDAEPDDTAAFRGVPRAESSLSIQVSRGATDAIDVTPPPERTRTKPERPTLERPRFPSDSDETLLRERVAPPRDVDLQTPMPELAPPPLPGMPPPPLPGMPPPPLPGMPPPPPMPRTAPAPEAAVAAPPMPPPLPPPRPSRQVEAVAPQRASRPVLPFEASPPLPRSARTKEPSVPPPIPLPRSSRAMEAAVPPPIPPPREPEATVAPPVPPPREVDAPPPAPLPREPVAPAVPGPIEPEPTATSEQAARAKPKVKTRTRPKSTLKTRAEPAPAAPPRPESEPGPAIRPRRSVVWLILLMVALGAGATAAAYYWPELYGP